MNAVTMTREVKISRMALLQAHAALLSAVKLDRAGDLSRLDRRRRSFRHLHVWRQHQAFLLIEVEREVLSKERLEALSELSKALQESAPGAAR
jgi:hypothetical protein